MNNIVNVSDFRNHISDYINRIIYKNDSFLLKKGKTVVVKVTAYNRKEKAVNDKKAKSFVGIWDNKDGEIIKKYARRLRKTKLFSF